MGSTLPNPLEVFEAGALVEARYEVECHLGGGGMAVVFVARDRKLHKRRVVLKSPFPSPSFRAADLRARFEEEIADLIRLGRVNGVVDILDQGVHRGCPFYVAQWMNGGSLQDRLGPDGRQAAEDVAAWLRPIARALDTVHEAKFVHRDVKPDNILFGEDGLACLADFGIARVFSGGASGLTTGYTKIGTQAYWAPEQEAGIPLDGRADQFSLAATAYKALTGRPPATRGTPDRVREHAPAVTKGCETAIHRALQPKRGNRYSTCAAFAVAFCNGVPKSKSVRTSLPTREAQRQTRKPDDSAAIPEPVASRRSTAAIWSQWVGVAVIALGLIAGGLYLAGLLPTLPEPTKRTARTEPPVESSPNKTPHADVTRPVITLTFPPRPTYESSEPVVTITGRVQDEHLAILVADGAAIPVRNGTFSLPVAVKQGTPRAIVLRARDQAGNESETLTVVLSRKRADEPWHKLIQEFVAAAEAGDLRAAARAYENALDARAPSTAIPAKHERAVLAWREPPQIQVIAPVDGATVDDPYTDLVVRWASGRKTDKFLIDGRPKATFGDVPERLQGGNDQFTLSKALQPGLNVVMLSIRDDKEVRWEQTLRIHLKIPPSSSTPPIPKDPPKDPAPEANPRDPAREAELARWIARLEDKNDDIVFSATIELAKLKDLRAAPPLVTALRRHRDFYVRLGAATALGEINALDGVQALIAALLDADDLVRTAANEALGRITKQDFGFSAQRNLKERTQIQAKFQRWWNENENNLRAKWNQPKR